MDRLTEKSCVEFAEVLSSKAPVPGGGGAAALVGALAAALCSMAANYTVGKKKYAAVENDVKMNLEKCKELQKKLLELIEVDAAAFEPLSRAYAVPKDNPQRENILEEAAYHACEAPIEMMRCCCRTIDLLEEMQIKGSVMLISDVGCGAMLCRAALESAGLNVFINTKLMKDHIRAGILEKEADDMLNEYLVKAFSIAEAVTQKIRK